VGVFAMYSATRALALTNGESFNADPSIPAREFAPWRGDSALAIAGFYVRLKM
jgi:hypothetical protein